MRLNDLILQLANADRSDFHPTSEHVRTWFPDALVQIVLEDPEQPFNEPWVKNFADPGASRMLVHIKYGGATVHTETFVSVDGGRHMLPMPESQKSLKIDKLEYLLAELFNDDLDTAMSQAGMTRVDRHAGSCKIL
jgi:hypothetical protein